jgi:hypothetical protein
MDGSKRRKRGKERKKERKERERESTIVQNSATKTD